MPDHARARRRLIWPSVALALILAWPGMAGAGRPLDTEDTGIAERVEVEIAATYQTASDGDSGAFTTQVSVGLLANLEASVAGAVAFGDPTDAAAQAGIGDTIVAVKYRLVDEAPSWPALLGRLTLRFPTGDEARGLGADGVDVGLLLAASRTLGAITLTVNAGYTITTGSADADVVVVAGAAEWGPGGVWRLVGELVGQVPVGRDAVGTAVVRVGATWDVFVAGEAPGLLRKATLDGAIGAGLTSASPDLVATIGVTLVF